MRNPRPDNTPAPELSYQWLQEAAARGASDLHLEPRAQHAVIRLRIDGLLQSVAELPKSVANAIISHLKIKANLDIAEKRLPQDGRFKFSLPKQTLICRVSTLPVLHGEKLVLRLLSSVTSLPSLATLGFEPHQLTLLTTHLQRPQGLILITGATGSGKTTTLYSALQHINCPSVNISTVEDPIEIELDHINQVNVHAKIGLSFAHALRALLRQDPDVMMIGEIRDLETATIATHAAQTGHLVLSTLHCNSAIEAFSRLRLMGIQLLDLVESLNLIVAQRLIRLACPHCFAPSAAEPSGCLVCHAGFKGRTGLFECLALEEPIKQQLLSASNWQQTLQQLPFLRLQQVGQAKVASRLTSAAELQRCLMGNG